MPQYHQDTHFFVILDFYVVTTEIEKEIVTSCRVNTKYMNNVMSLVGLDKIQ